MKMEEVESVSVITKIVICFIIIFIIITMLTTIWALGLKY